MSDVRAVSFWPYYYDSAIDTMSAREIPDPPFIPAIDTRKPWLEPFVERLGPARVYEMLVEADR